MSEIDAQYCVYWIHDETCSSPEHDGYVGITKHPKKRERQHRKSGKFPQAAEFTVIARGSREECLGIERQYRLRPGIGWNNAAGGEHCPIHSAETRAKIAAAGKGKKYCLGHKLTGGHKAKIAAAMKGRKHTREARERMKVAQAGAGRGRTLSLEHRKAISKGGKGRIFSDETKKKIRDAVLGNKNSLGRKRPDISSLMKGNTFALGNSMSDAARAKISAAVKARVVSDETRQKLSEYAKLRGVLPSTRIAAIAALKGKPWPEARRRAFEASKK